MATVAAPRRGGTTRLIDDVFHPGLMGALERVRLRVPHASGERPGHTRVRNRTDPSGTEIDRHHTYMPGDDLRRVDWNIYARLGELLTKRFVAEREVPVWILIDRSGSMGPSERASKLDTALAITAILGAVSLAGGDRLYVGVVPGRNAKAPGGFDQCGPLRGHRGLSQLREFLIKVEPAEGEGDLKDALGTALRHIRRGLVILVSDFLTPFERIVPALDVIRNRPSEGKLVQVLSREDQDPSWLRGQDRLLDRETGQMHMIEPSVQTWKRYQELLDAHLASLRREALIRGMSSVVTITGAGLEHFLREDLPRLGLRLVR